MKFRIQIEQDEDGVFVANCPSLPGCWSQGATRDNALRNIEEAMKGCIESLEKKGDPIPAPITEEVIDVQIQRRAG